MGENRRGGERRGEEGTAGEKREGKVRGRGRGREGLGPPNANSCIRPSVRDLGIRPQIA